MRWKIVVRVMGISQVRNNTSKSELAISDLLVSETDTEPYTTRILGVFPLNHIVDDVS